MNYLGFMDESGVLSPQADQRFFALGLLKIEDTSTLYDQLVCLKNRFESNLNEMKKKKGLPLIKKFEFKFNLIKRTSYRFYLELINLYFDFPNLSFCCLVFDKENPDFDVSEYFRELWDAYISYSKMLVRNNIAEGENICLIADYLGKPKSSPLFFEKEIRAVNGIYNACMIESHASLFIQLVDILIGCILFDYKIFRGKKKRINKYKKSVLNLLKKKLSVDSLEGNFTKHAPNYFSVWEFRP